MCLLSVCVEEESDWDYSRGWNIFLSVLAVRTLMFVSSKHMILISPKAPPNQ